jgi:uncharacterized protein YjgD (DUF1641 family)
MFYNISIERRINMGRCKHRSVENPKMDSLISINGDNVYCPHCGKIIKPLSPNGDTNKEVDKIATDYYNLIETINILAYNNDDEELNSFLDYMLGEEGIEKTKKMLDKAFKASFNEFNTLSMYQNQSVVQKINNMGIFMGKFDQYPIFHLNTNVSDEIDNN